MSGHGGAIRVRPGDALDTAALTVWLHEQAPTLIGTGTAPLRLSQFSGGFSNLTYLVELGDRRVVLRRPPRGVAAGPAHDMSREYRTLSALAPTAVPVPAPILFCDDASVLGTPFYLMEFVEGRVLRAASPSATEFNEHTARQLARVAIGTLAQLHALSVEELGLQRAHAESYVARQLRGWTKRWEAAKTSEVPAMTALAGWLAAAPPADAGESLIHNDFKYDNLVLDPVNLTTVRAVLDWEMATVGCPLMDLGTTLAYWMEPHDPPLLRALGLGATASPGSPTRQGVLELYGAASGRPVTNPVFYFVFGLFKLAVVAQQLYARHRRGLSSDPRFAGLDAAVEALAGLGVAALERDRV